MTTSQPLDETTLDPKDPQEWEALRALGHRMVDDVLTYLETLRERPVWQPMPEDVRTNLNAPLPEGPQDPQVVYEEFLSNVLPYPTGNIHPRFFGWVVGTGTPLGVLSEMLAATLNPNAVGGNFGSTPVEHQVLNWCKAIFGFPAEASGLLVTGGSLANLIGLTVARNTKAEIDLRAEGLTAVPRKMVFYASREVHNSNQLSAELLGLGADALRAIPINADFQMDLAALEAAIAEDRAAGHHPFCVIGCAGTVNTGAFDDLDALADICQREGLWLHVDGAFGAFVALSPDLRHHVKGMDRADSIAFDLHKWIGVPFDAGCVLVRDSQAHLEAFTLTADYLEHGERGIAAAIDNPWLSDYTFELSRAFRALKVWMDLKTNGFDTYRALIEQNVAQIRYLADLVEAEPKLEIAAPYPTNVLCLRYVADDLNGEQLSALNEELLLRLQEGGVAAPSYTMIDGNYVIRVANVNHRSRREDFDVMVREIVRLGDALLAEM